MDSPHVTTKPVAPARATIIGFVAGLSAIMPLTTDIYLIVMPSIARDLAASPAAVQSTMAIFALGFGLAHLFVGVLADRWGRRPVAIIGLALFIAATTAVMLSPNLEALGVYRFIQGLVSASCPILARAIVRDAVPPQDAARAFATSNAISAIAPLASPFVGGWLDSVGGWRLAIAVVVGYAVVLALAVLVRLPETAPVRAKPGQPMQSPLSAASEILSNKTFLFGAVIATLSYTTLFCWLTTAPFLLFDTFGYSKTAAGIVFGCGSLGFMIGSLDSARLASRTRPERLLVRGAVLMLTGAVLCFALLTVGRPHPLALLVAMSPLYFGLGLVHSNTLHVVMRPFSRIAGQASAWLGLINQTGGAMITMVAVMLGAGLATVGVMISCCVLMIVATIGLSRSPRSTPPTAADRTADHSGVRYGVGNSGHGRILSRIVRIAMIVSGQLIEGGWDGQGP